MLARPNSDRSPLYDVRKPAAAVLSDSSCEAMFRGRCGLAHGRQVSPSAPLSGTDAAAFTTNRPAEPKLAQPAKAGGARRDRTDDLMLAKHALSQLSYGPVTRTRMPSRPIVMTTSCPRSPSPAQRRSSLRSRRPAEPKLHSSEGWWAWEDLNFRPHAYQARALTN